MNETAKFFAMIDADTATEIVANIARHYDVSPKEALYEVTAAGAEHLLDYVTGPMRLATSLLMKRHGMG